MSLPPEKLSIKRRRDEDPVDKLYIDEAQPLTKRLITRRFTDYYFQRLPADTPTDGAPKEEAGPQNTQRVLRTPRSVSSLNIPNPRASRAFKASGVPIVRATAPGDEFRDAQRILNARNEAAEKRKNALNSTPDHVVPKIDNSSGIEFNTADAQPNIPGGSVVRRFRITPSTGANSLGSLRGPSGGIQKNKAQNTGSGIAVLVEQERRSNSRNAPMTAYLNQQVDEDATAKEALNSLNSVNATVESVLQGSLRKRPVVNQAELKWRQEQQRTVSAAKTNIASTFEKTARAKNTTWDEHADRLAEEFEQVALDIEQRDKAALSPLRQVASPQAPKYFASKQKQHKFKPHPPTKPRPMECEDDWVYDVYIRRPMTEGDGLKNPLAEVPDQTSKAVDSGVGVIMITPEDQELWDDFAEEDEDEKWDSEDADSNAEDNPANDYPDESSEDDEWTEDSTAKEWRNHYNRGLQGRSNPLREEYDCEEEYDFACDDYDDGVQFSGWREDPDYDSNVESP
ncbi:hypothetical protein N7495_003171 [Penicillium taxi]|uniref:uncharacterized protein n=1 Tax=Penicillium taxi TaxID=168475 RepID=UPI002545BDB4|nr:uncharacterized protein N7495_003171 [Penicillium taxi]KAJ5902643.1 hypothetical protein N7495_003171 [Penicillium taxi]